MKLLNLVKKTLIFTANHEREYETYITIKMR